MSATLIHTLQTVIPCGEHRHLVTCRRNFHRSLLPGVVRLNETTPLHIAIVPQTAAVGVNTHLHVHAQATFRWCGIILIRTAASGPDGKAIGAARRHGDRLQHATRPGIPGVTHML